MNYWGARFLALLLGWGAVVFAQEVSAACQVEASAGERGRPLLKKLASTCTPAEREAHAVDGADILDALERGQQVDLAGVIVRGDLTFDRFPVQAVKTKPGRTSEQQDPLTQASEQELRLVRGALTISDSVVQGAVRHRSAQGMLRFEGPVDFHGTTFNEGWISRVRRFRGRSNCPGRYSKKRRSLFKGDSRSR
jgi:hypothetical protein